MAAPKMLILTDDVDLAAQIVADIEACFLLIDHGRQWRKLGMGPDQWIDYLRAAEAPELREAVLRCLEADGTMLTALAEEIWTEVTWAPAATARPC